MEINDKIRGYFKDYFSISSHWTLDNGQTGDNALADHSNSLAICQVINKNRFASYSELLIQ